MSNATRLGLNALDVPLPVENATDTAVSRSLVGTYTLRAEQVLALSSPMTRLEVRLRRHRWPVS